MNYKLSDTEGLVDSGFRFPLCRTIAMGLEFCGRSCPALCLDDKTRLYQILFKHNRPEISYAEYDDPLVRAAVEQRAAFLRSKSDQLYSIEIY